MKHDIHCAPLERRDWAYHDSIDMPPRWGGGTAINMSLRWG